ncbi:MAG TPA: XdhC/CoxI family protein [Gemmataceae bacterium]|nr:XdhC/CoxI family protein [Gemmataceae bacterium]
MRTLLADLTAALDQERQCVCCMVVETRGSTPQKAGAAMLVFADGSQRGTLGGGCVEAEVRQRALRVLTAGSGRPEVLTFCLDDNYGWDDGLICGGRMTILADPLGSARAADYYHCLRRLIEDGRGCTQAIAVAAASGLAPGDRFLFDAAGQLAARTTETAATEEVLQNLAPLAERPAPSSRHGIAYLPVLPRITLFIVGAGHVGQAVARLAAEVDFDVWVLDDRASCASRERFPSAERLLIGEIGPSLQQLAPTLNPSTYCLIVTRGHNHDEEALYHLAATPASYVGMIGSKRKIKLIFEDLLAKGVTRETLARVHAPLGFAIGSQTVPEIAVSIVAELIACRNLGTSEPRPRIRTSLEPAHS